MKNKSTLIIGAIAVVLIIIYLAFMRGPKVTKSIDAEQFQVNAREVATLVIFNAEDTLSFSRDGQNWWLDDYPADTNRMNSMLESFAELKTDRLISSNPDNHERYEVTDSATRIQFFDTDGKVLGDLLIGKQGSNYNETLVRRPESDKVYAVSTSLSRYHKSSKNGYWDRTMTQFDVNSLAAVSFSGEVEYNLANDNGVWTYEGEAVDTKKVTDMLRPLGNMRGSNFHEEALTVAPYQTITVTLHNGEQTVLAFHKVEPEGSAVVVSVTGKAKLFEFSKASLNRYDKSLEDLAIEEES